MGKPLDSATQRALGFATGVAFGALLQHGRLARYDVILDQLRLRDGRVVKAMGSAVVVGALGLQALERRGLGKTEVKPLKLGGILAGGVLFGAGLATFGYCPGTSVAAVGEGHRDALAGVAGMMAGAAAFVALYPKLAPLIDAGDLGKLTLPNVTATRRSSWVKSMALAGVAAAAVDEGLQRSHRVREKESKPNATASRPRVRRASSASPT